MALSAVLVQCTPWFFFSVVLYAKRGTKLALHPPNLQVGSEEHCFSSLQNSGLVTKYAEVQTSCPVGDCILDCTMHHAVF